MVSAHKIRSFPRQKREKICSFAVKFDIDRTAFDIGRTADKTKKGAERGNAFCPFLFFKISLLKERQTRKNLRP